MGADLLLTTLTHDAGKKLDWTKGRQVARKLPIDVVQARLEEINGDPCDSAKEARTELNDIITTLKAELKNGTHLHDAGGGDAYTYEVGGKVLHLRVGTSSDGWNAFTNAGYFPQVLKAIGFDVELDPEQEVEDWIDQHGEEVQVSFTCPVEVIVNLRTGTIEQVVAIDEGVALETDLELKPNVNTRTLYQPVENDEVVRRAVEIADGDVEWPAWQHGW